MRRSAQTWAMLAPAILASWLWTSPAPAQPAGEPLPPPQLALELWTLDRLVELMRENHPDLAIAHARLEAARGRLIQAGLYPNPTFTWEAEDVGAREGSAGNQGPVLGQQIITAGKRRLAMAAAQAGVSQADWNAITAWYDTLTRLRLAYYDLAMADREVMTHQANVALSREGLQAANALLKAKVGTQVDVLRAQVELEDHRARLAVARARRDAAWRLLAAAVGLPRLPAGSLMENLEAPAPDYDYEQTVQAVLTRSSLVQAAQAGILQAERLVLKARADWIPNLELQARPFYSFPEQNAQVTILAGAALPIFNRNQGNIRTAQAELGLAQAEARQVEIQLSQRLASSFEQFHSARQQVDAYRKNILPAAEQSLLLIRKGYEAGDPKYDYTSVLQAQRTLIDAQLSYVRALGQLWKGVAEIRGLLQDDGGPCGGESEGTRCQ